MRCDLLLACFYHLVRQSRPVLAAAFKEIQREGFVPKDSVLAGHFSGEDLL